MGQAFRRATGRIGSSTVDTASQLRKPIERPPPPPSSSVPTGKQPTGDITHDSGNFNAFFFITSCNL